MSRHGFIIVSVKRDVFEFTPLETRLGYYSFQATGKNAEAIFANESGGHRFQRVPPTERRGRIQTSTITVAVLKTIKESELSIPYSDLEITTCRGTGPGGQHRNKTESAVQIKHIPSGLMIRCEDGRSQQHNRELALTLLRTRLQSAIWNKKVEERAQDRKSQVGSGMRGDKRRTIREQDGIVTDHVLGKQWNYNDYKKGNW